MAEKKINAYWFTKDELRTLRDAISTTPNLKDGAIDPKTNRPVYAMDTLVRVAFQVQMPSVTKAAVADKPEDYSFEDGETIVSDEIFNYVCKLLGFSILMGESDTAFVNRIASAMEKRIKENDSTASRIIELLPMRESA